MPTRRGITVDPDPNGDVNFYINSNQNPSGFNFKNGNGNTTLMTIQQSGIVGIGIDPLDFNNGTGTNYHLYVAGGILTEAVTVAVKRSADWNDYVFDSTYKLKKLSEVADYVNKNHHLEGIPSADEVVKSGYDIAKMDSKLLGKIEELTLYMINMQKQIDTLTNENKQLTEQLKK